MRSVPRRAAALGVLFAAQFCLPATARALARQVVSGGAGPPVVSAPMPAGPTPLAPGSGVISGVVTDGTTKAPVAGVVVYIGMGGRGAVGDSSRQLTDAKGRFVFTDLPASDAYSFNASKAGYVDGGYRRIGGVGAPLVLRDGEWLNNADITLWRPSAIGGTVVDEGGEPLVGVYVRVLAEVTVAGRPHTVPGPVTTTDDRGMYRIGDLQPGRYLVEVPSVQSALPAKMPQTVTDPPRPGKTDPALDLGTAGRLVLAHYPTPPPSENGRTWTYPMTFYPGVRSAADAGAIEVAYGSERATADFTLSPVPATRVSGHLDGPPDAFTNLLLRLRPAGAEDGGFGSEAATTLATPDGSFTFLNVPAGEYVIEVKRSVASFRFGSSFGPGVVNLPPAPGLQLSTMSGGTVASGPSGLQYYAQTAPEPDTYWGHAAVTVGGQDLADLAIPMHPAVTLSGRVVREQTSPAPPGRSVGFTAVVADPADGDFSRGLQEQFGNRGGPADVFTIRGLLGGKYLLRVPGSTIKSITWQDRDYTYTPLDTTASGDITNVIITLTDQVSVLTGLVRDHRGGGVSNGALLAFPAEPSQWIDYGFQPARLKSVPVNNDGSYKFQNLPAGEYYLLAVDASQADEWHDPKFLEAAAKVGTRVSLAWGERKAQDLHLVTVVVK
jgi:hypothetical protein